MGISSNSVLALVDLSMTAERALAMASSIAAELVRRPQAGFFVFDIEARIHARFVVGRRDQTGEDLPRLRFGVGGKAVLSPSCAHKRLGAGAISCGKKRSRQRKPAFGCLRRLIGEKGDHRARVRLLLPQRGFGAPPQKQDAWPAWIAGDEGRVAREVEIGLVTAQDDPFNQLARDRIVNSALDARRLVGPAFLRELDRLFDGGKIKRRGDRRACCRERWTGPNHRGGDDRSGQGDARCRASGSIGVAAS